jgi:F0F1-type ATP synthase alpha subunit
VISIGDGIACVYGLNKIQAWEMVEFASGRKTKISKVFFAKGIGQGQKW